MVGFSTMNEKLREFCKKLDENPNPAIKGESGFTHLHWAVMDRNVCAVEYLLESGADPNHMATSAFGEFNQPSLDFQRRLQRFGIELNAQNYWGVRELTSLHIAASLDSVEVMKLLFKYGAIFDFAGYRDLNPVHCALCAESLNALHALLRNGFDPDGKDGESRTILHWLAMYHADERVTMFLGGQFSKFGMNLKDPVNASRAMLDRGAGVSAQDGSGNTPLHLAAATNMYELANEFLEYGAQVNSGNYSGATPLHLAAWFNSKEVADLLLRHGAQVDSKDTAGNTPLHIATADDALVTRDVYLPHGACCSRHENNVVVNLLVQNGASVSAQNSEGHTPLSIAQSKRASKDTFEFLSSCGN